MSTFALALLLAGCAPAASAGGKSPQPLDGRTFVAASVSRAGAEQPVGHLRIRFTGSRIEAVGCNHLQGDVRTDGGRLTVSNLGGTLMACDEAVMKQDDWVRAFLMAGPTWRVEGHRLILAHGTDELRLTDGPATTTPLVGTNWRVAALADRGVASSLPAGVSASLRLTPDGGITGNAGCNSFGGRAHVEGEQLTVTNLVSTKRACGGERDRVERGVLGALRGPATVRVEGTSLTLTGADGHALQLTT